MNQTVVADDDQALAALDAAGFDPRSVAVVPAIGPVLPAQGEPGQAAAVVEARPGHLVLDVTASREGLLVISQPFYPGWRAYVDGQKAPIYRADYLLQAVPVSTGAHRVELTYRLPLLPMIVSLVAAVGCLAGLLLQIPSRRPILRRA